MYRKHAFTAAERFAGEDIPRAASVAAAGVLIVQAVDDVELLFVLFERREALPELHVRAVPLGPPMWRRDAVADEHAGEPLGRLFRGSTFRPKQMTCFEPGEREGNAQT